jgi:AraC family chitin signaling transcriptional activator
MVTNLYLTRSGLLYIGTDHGLYVYDSNKIRYLAQSAALGRSINVAESRQGYLWFVNSRGVFVQHPGAQNFEPVALNEPNLLARCVEASGSGIWLTSSKGLSFYSHDGIQQKNFSAPFGLVNNEFLPNICTSNQDELLLGSQRGIVRVFPKQLLATAVPASRVLFSKVLVNDEVYKIGDPTPDVIKLDYTSSVKFKLGILPDFDQKHLQYRLSGNGSEPWSTLEGTELTFSHLAPGNYILNVRTEAQAQKGLTGSAVTICVAYPWYMNPWSMLLFMFIVLLAGGSLFVWRSNRVNHLNARLQQLVATKTRQLVQQHQVLEGTTQNLRREQAILNRYIANITRNAAEHIQSIQDGDTHAWWQHAHERMADMFSGLLLLDPKASQMDCRYSVCMQTFLSSAIDYWLTETRRQGLSIALECRTDTPLASLTVFNLQRLFTVLIQYQLEVEESGQVVHFIIESRDGYLFVTTHMQLADQSDRPGSVEEEVQRIGRLVESMQVVNLGRFVKSWQDGTLTVTLSWPQFQNKQVGGMSDSASDVDIQGRHHTEEENLWLNQVYALIESECSDPEFTTSIAAKKLYMSERSLQRKFKQQTGRTFTEHLHQIRMDNACKLLVSGKKVAEAAFLSGYNDPSYFSRKFKLHYGLSPSAFLEKAG